MNLLLAGLGAAAGAVLRYLVGHHLDSRLRLHWGTLLVNVAGSFVLGWVVGRGTSGAALALLGTGFCGGLTTYSAFAVQTVDHPARHGFVYVVLTMAGCLAAAWLGLQLGGT